MRIMIDFYVIYLRPTNVYVCIHTYMSYADISQTVMFVDVPAESYDPMNPFSVSSETSSKCCWGHVHQHQQFKSITT